MKSLLPVLFIICSLHTSAQKGKQPPKPKETFRIIKMEKFPIVDRLDKSTPFADVRIIQKVRDSVRLGYSTGGINKHIVTIKSAKPLTKFIQEHIYKMYKKQFDKNGLQVLIYIKELRLGEKEAMQHWAYTRFNADGFISSDGVKFRKISNIDTVFITAFGRDVKNGHAENIERSIKVLLKQTLLGDINKQKNIEEKTIDQITLAPIHELHHPILTTEIYKEGAYKNFEEFLKNEPSITDYSTKVDKKKNITIVSDSTSEKPDTLQIWGVCKKGEIYKYYDRALIAVEKEGSGFIISDYITNRTRRNNNLMNAAIAGAVIGGLVGNAIYLFAALNSEKPLLVKSIAHINKEDQQPEATCIDMRTGEFSF